VQALDDAWRRDSAALETDTGLTYELEGTDHAVEELLTSGGRGGSYRDPTDCSEERFGVLGLEACCGFSFHGRISAITSPEAEAERWGRCCSEGAGEPGPDRPGEHECFVASNGGHGGENSAGNSIGVIGADGSAGV
jgi:hypothetical protein